MKTLKQYLTERLLIKKGNYKYFPETKKRITRDNKTTYRTRRS